MTLIASVLVLAGGLLLGSLLSSGPSKGSSDVSKHLAKLPAESTAIVALDVKSLVDKAFLAQLNQMLVMTGQKRIDWGEFQIEAVDYILGARSADDATGIIIGGRFDAKTLISVYAQHLGLKVREDGSYGSKPNLALQAAGDHAIAIGQPKAVEALVASYTGKAGGLSAGPLMRYLSHIDDGGALIIAMSDKERGGALSIGLSSDLVITVFVHGLPEALASRALSQLSMIKERVSALSPEMLRSLLDQDGSKSKIAKIAPGLDTGAAVEMALSLVKSAKLSRVDGGLRGEASASTSKGAQSLTLFLSSLSVIAVPAFIKYLRRAATTEAIDNLDVLYKGASVYYASPQLAKDGRKLPCQFPKTVACTPSGSACDMPEQRFPGDKGLWEHPTWRALRFELRTPHRFKYCFTATGAGADATMQITAHADLDCDGVWSTFQRVAFGDRQASMAGCSLRGAPTLYTEQETE